MSDDTTQAGSAGAPRTPESEPSQWSDDALHAVHEEQLRKKEEPREGFEAVSIWLTFLFGGLLFFCGVYLAKFSGQFDPLVYDETLAPDAVEVQPPTLAEVGQRLYTQNCQACHMADGSGIPGTFPPLAQNPHILGSEERLARILINGMVGELEVQGVVYNGVMPGFGHLNDRQIAALLTYIRQSWGNDAEEVEPETVAEVRGEIGGRAQAWTQDELQAYE